MHLSHSCNINMIGSDTLSCRDYKEWARICLSVCQRKLKEASMLSALIRKMFHLSIFADFIWRNDDDDDEMMKPLFKCHKILVHYSTNWGH